MKIYRKIIIIVTVIIAIVLIVLLCNVIPVFKTMGTDHPNQTDFEQFEDYSLMVAESLDSEIIGDKDVIATHRVDGNNLIVEIESITYGYGIKSVYPISDFIGNTENSEIKAVIQYEDVKHEYYSFIHNMYIKNKIIAILVHFVLIALESGGISYGFYTVVYMIPEEIRKEIKSKKFNKKN